MPAPADLSRLGQGAGLGEQTTTLVSGKMPAARSAMCFHAAGTVHGLLEGFAVGLAQHAVGALEHGGTFALRAGAEAVDVAGDFDLLAQGQALDSTDDGFDDGHTVAKISS